MMFGFGTTCNDSCMEGDVQQAVWKRRNNGEILGQNVSLHVTGVDRGVTQRKLEDERGESSN